MTLVLICSARELVGELRATVIGRDDVEWRVVRDSDQALAAARQVPPGLIVLDRDLPGAGPLVVAIRADPATRRTSIVIAASDDFETIEVELLELGANAVLRLPAGPDWDARLLKLMDVPLRRAARLPVVLEVAARAGDAVGEATGVARNLSVHGMLLESSSPLRVGDDLDMRFSLADAAGEITGCGRVVRSGGRSQYGVEFYGLEDDGEDRVRRFVEAGA